MRRPLAWPHGPHGPPEMMVDKLNTRLLESMREVGAGEQATALASRLSAVGRFDQFIQFSGNVEQFRLGREPDGSAAPFLDMD
ncbi:MULTISPECIES: hypothetical protein [Streptomyces]|uniref:hypothetical protein n=1 Tax=Streptomyces TaxID=1883 RepID=UPI00142FA3C2|nr:hypothetical protein [Streptomyces sp. 2BBP-J2]NIL50493.1 hypothetical protein [Streptomyces sp. 2BBP-J2]